ncbi:outer membrane beta-barrel protein [Parabacteroides sp. Marseille-P3160]|uniref:outer membrane beta-barrel protein n=1 Tax=Parabacteroides sp. Marseille-P3160 TaxID=1917887 RepID=UPI0013573671|nr:outer membrane beta-barrel protein [Parabacteroides sp. Marseille-P3160]
MRKKLLVLLTVFCALSLHVQGQIESGLVVGVGLGSLNTDINPSTQEKIKFSEVDYKSNFSIGYRFRIRPAEVLPLFVDLDANLGIKSWHSSYSNSLSEPPLYEASSQYYFLSAGGTANYPIYKAWSIGAGIEPTYYFKQDGESSNNEFDVPLVGKLAYHFKLFELGISYKYGLMNTIKTDYIKSGKFRDWQLSIWIPF